MSDAAKVSIVNQALSMVGKEPVVDLSDTSLEANGSAAKLMRQIDNARDTVLNRHGFTCALQYARISPAILEGYANFRYPTVYLLPGDALRVWEIDGRRVDEWPMRWQAGTFQLGGAARQIIRAVNADNALPVAYVRRAAWEALDTAVANAVAGTLAASCAWNITGDRAAAGDLAKQAEALAQMAISVDSTQEGGQPPLAVSIPQLLRNRSR